MHTNKKQKEFVKHGDSVKSEPNNHYCKVLTGIGYTGIGKTGIGWSLFEPVLVLYPDGHFVQVSVPRKDIRKKTVPNK